MVAPVAVARRLIGVSSVIPSTTSGGRRHFMMRMSVAVLLAATLAVACGKKSTSTPTPTVTGVIVTGNGALTSKNQTSQLTATANLSDSHQPERQQHCHMVVEQSGHRIGVEYGTRNGGFVRQRNDYGELSRGTGFAVGAGDAEGRQ